MSRFGLAPSVAASETNRPAVLTVGPTGATFGRWTPGTTTSGIQEAIDSAAGNGGGTVEIANTGAPYDVSTQLVLKRNVNIRGNNAVIRNANPALKEPFITDKETTFFATTLQDLLLDGNAASTLDPIAVGSSPFTYTNPSDTPRLIRVTGGKVPSVAVGGSPVVAPHALNGYYLIPGAKDPVPTLTLAFEEAPTVGVVHPVLTLQTPQKCNLDLNVTNPGDSGYCILWTTNQSLKSAVVPPATASGHNRVNLRMDARGGGGLVMGGDGQATNGPYPVANNAGVIVQVQRAGTFGILQPAWCDSNIFVRASCRVSQSGALGIVSNSNGGGMTDQGVYNNRWLNVSVDVAPNKALGSAFQLGRCGAGNEANGKGVWIDQIYSSVGAGATLSAVYTVLPQNGYLVGTSFCFDSLNNVWWYRGQRAGKYLWPFIQGQVINKAQTGADGSLLTLTPPKVAGLYRLHCILNVKAAAGAAVGWTATWTDGSGIPQAPTNLAWQQVGAAAPALEFMTSGGTGAQDYYGSVAISIDNSGAPIVIKTTVRGGALQSAVGSAWIERVG
jgi:hypothetical protein